MAGWLAADLQERNLELVYRFGGSREASVLLQEKTWGSGPSNRRGLPARTPYFRRASQVASAILQGFVQTVSDDENATARFPCQCSRTPRVWSYAVVALPKTEPSIMRPL